MLPSWIRETGSWWKWVGTREEGDTTPYVNRLSAGGDKSGNVCQCYINGAGYCNSDTGNVSMNPARPTYDAEFPRLSPLI